MPRIPVRCPYRATPIQFGGKGKGGGLSEAANRPLHLNAPDHLVVRAEPKLAEGGDAHLGEPSLIGDC